VRCGALCAFVMVMGEARLRASGAGGVPIEREAGDGVRLGGGVVRGGLSAFVFQAGCHGKKSADVRVSY
jgi:hypothetical protein